MGGTVTVRGWKLDPLPEFSTAICPDCVETKRAVEAARIKKMTTYFVRAAVGAAVLAVVLFVAKVSISPSTLSDHLPAPLVGALLYSPALLGGVAALCGASAFGWRSERKKLQSTRAKDSSSEDLARQLHEAVVIQKAGHYLPEGPRDIIELDGALFRPFGDPHPGDVLLHRVDISRLSPYATGGGWSLILARWKTDGSNDTSTYSPDLLKDSMTNLGFKDAGEFLNAK